MVTCIDFPHRTFADRFMAFLLAIDFFSHAVRTYPGPRKKHEMPLWILICCALQMKLHTTSSFSRLPGIPGSGAILSRFGCKVADTECYRNCYALSELLHVFIDEPGYIVAGYQLDKGNTDELSQGRALVNEFVKAAGAGVMQLLIVDRGYMEYLKILPVEPFIG